MDATIRIELSLVDTVDLEEDDLHQLASRLVEIRNLLENDLDEEPAEGPREGSLASSVGSKNARPQKEYREPVYKALVDLGGGAHRDEIFNLIEQRLDLSEADREKTEGGHTRWKKHVEWIITKLRPTAVKPSSEAGWGVWELTDHGWDVAREMGLVED